MTDLARRILDAAPCKRQCAGGRRCVCLGASHQHHICADPACACHQPAAYGLVRVVNRNGAERYEGVRVIRR